jgi:hypothetical protein
MKNDETMNEIKMNETAKERQWKWMVVFSGGFFYRDLLFKKRKKRY